jgi:predicted permease
LLTLFTENLLPVFLAAGAGYALAARMRLDPRPISQLAFHLLAPCLVLQVILESEVDGRAFLRMSAFTAVSLLVPAAAALAIGRALRWRRSWIAATILVVLLPNAGNFGLSVNRLAFGKAGLSHASVYFVTAAVMTFTVGVFVASLGRRGLLGTLAGLLRVPAIWAVVAALALTLSGQSLPLPVARTVELLSHASIPIFLVVLGMQLHGKGVAGPWQPLIVACSLRLAGGVAVGLALAGLFDLDGPAYRAAVLQSAMPTAVITIVLATEYDLEPAFVTSVVVVTTLLAPLTLTPLIAFLGA